ncbi:hypothetical protein JKP88DRAFT_316631 [Tribonema minus]|uniref:Uncharacterized protein n=1 Tax=Tribonema minus TaxID=303371 RepID=A0A835YY45_9STRA|nr:hypothetical protein JKP88DRAFT_316631 [Tribonema minus]
MSDFTCVSATPAPVPDGVPGSSGIDPAVLAEVDQLRSTDKDPVTAPYTSKYKAKDVLTEHVASLPALAASDRVRLLHRLGIIAFETEENHVADAKLSAAVEPCYPGLAQAIADAAGDEHETAANEQPPVPTTAPPIAATPLALSLPAETMECLTKLGVIWAQRACPRRALLYLLTAGSFRGEVARGGGELKLQSGEDEELKLQSGEERGGCTDQEKTLKLQSGEERGGSADKELKLPVGEGEVRAAGTGEEAAGAKATAGAGGGGSEQQRLMEVDRMAAAAHCLVAAKAVLRGTDTGGKEQRAEREAEIEMRLGAVYVKASR